MFANAIRNAIEAVPPGGTITLHVFASQEWKGVRRPGARVVIADTGPGNSPQNRERIFDFFFTSKGENGTGLGLWVSSGIILKHGGSIRVRSSTRSDHVELSLMSFCRLRIRPTENQSALSVG